MSMDRRGFLGLSLAAPLVAIADKVLAKVPSLSEPPTRSADNIWRTKKPDCDLELWERTRRALSKDVSFIKKEFLARFWIDATGDGYSTSCVPTHLTRVTSYLSRLRHSNENFITLVASASLHFDPENPVLSDDHPFKNQAVTGIELIDDEGYGFPIHMFVHPVRVDEIKYSISSDYILRLE